MLFFLTEAPDTLMAIWLQSCKLQSLPLSRMALLSRKSLRSPCKQTHIAC